MLTKTFHEKRCRQIFDRRATVVPEIGATTVVRPLGFPPPSAQSLRVCRRALATTARPQHSPIAPAATTTAVQTINQNLVRQTGNSRQTCIPEHTSQIVSETTQYAELYDILQTNDRLSSNWRNDRRPTFRVCAAVCRCLGSSPPSVPPPSGCSCCFFSFLLPAQRYAVHDPKP